MFEFVHRSELNEGCHGHLRFEEGLVTKSIFKVPEGNNTVMRDTFLTILLHRIDSCIPTLGERQDVKKSCVFNILDRLTIRPIQFIVSPNDSGNLPSYGDTTTEYNRRFKSKHYIIPLETQDCKSSTIEYSFI